MACKAWKIVPVEGKTFKVPQDLEFVKKVGSGAYGTVASFRDPAGNKVAIKKMTRAFEDLTDGKRNLREIKLLQGLSHPNIVAILDMYPPESPDFDDIYIVQELMETDLSRVIHSKQVLTEEHHQFFVYQLLCGVYFLHSAHVVHRDLKPANLLVNKNCDLKICDFGLARGIDDISPLHVSNAPMEFSGCNGSYKRCGMHCGKPKFSHESGTSIVYFKDDSWRLHVIDDTSNHSFHAVSSSGAPPAGSWAHRSLRDYRVQVMSEPELTEYMVTRWYRAPEVTLLNSAYTRAIDIWSIGCVLGELMARKALFPGKDHLDQIKRIVQVMGTPSAEDLDWLPEQCAARNFLRRLPQSAKRSWGFQASTQAIDCMEGMLQFHPEKRPCAADIMRHGYFHVLHRSEDLRNVAKERVDWRFDNFEPTKRSLQNRVYVECARFHPGILQRDAVLLTSRGIDRLLPGGPRLAKGGC
jgi:serine/threonine protein kinase